MARYAEDYGRGRGSQRGPGYGGEYRREVFRPAPRRSHGYTQDYPQAERFDVYDRGQRRYGHEEDWGRESRFGGFQRSGYDRGYAGQGYGPRGERGRERYGREYEQGSRQGGARDYDHDFNDPYRNEYRRTGFGESSLFSGWRPGQGFIGGRGGGGFL